MQQAFLECDGFQCGYCTPGQILSAVGMLEEAKAFVPSPRYARRSACSRAGEPQR